MSSLSYNEQIDRENVLKLRKITLALPPYCKDFFEELSHAHNRELELPMLMI